MGLFNFLKREKINPLRGFMNMAVFSVSGVNPSTNRKKTVTVQAIDMEAAVAASGLLNPVATETGWERPTERQVAYAKQIGLSIPKGATQRDVSALLTRMEENDDGSIPSDLVLKAAENGMAMSFFTGPTQYKWMTEGHSVLVNPGSKVYHCENGGCSLIASDAQEMTEKQALASGLHRCKKCDWYYFDWDNGNG